MPGSAHGDRGITIEESYSIFEHERFVNYKEMIEQCPLQLISAMLVILSITGFRLETECGEGHLAPGSI